MNRKITGMMPGWGLVMMMMLCMGMSGVANADRAGRCIMDDRFFVQTQTTVGSRPFAAAVEPADSDSSASRSEMCSCAKAIAWTLLQEYNEQYPAAHLRGVERGGCQSYGDGGQIYKLYWRQ